MKWVESDCNLCSYLERLRQAKKEGMMITLIPAIKGGIDWYKHPQSINLDDLSKKEQKQYKRGWYGSMPDRCMC